MKQIFRLKFPWLLLILITVGCGPNRDIVYFSNLDDDDINKAKIIENVVIPTIQPDDLLSITVNSLSAESNMLFNQGVLGSLGSSVSDANRSRQSTQAEGYLVDKNGNINFPVLGRIHLGGLTKEAATDTIQNILNREYVKDPTVNIRFLNFKITLIGEVKNPSTVTILTEQVNILEAISLAGDLTVIGKRENVLIIREKDGERKLIRVNLNDKELLTSPNYFLQQNDIVYVEPDSFKAAQANLRRANIQFVLSTTLSALSVLTVILALSTR
ncbi:polysaccharide biosynthesis/export family protein [Cryomorpha ignava]|uniref:polysaccharide biosynthesis/export family protein n=1 Tax=Cryomorpha ignava TaxID=101383 RepID=UPI001953AAEA|nr:polysaccharide biosynthesis/export family protein [Cryomorpha ignava]